MRSSLLPANCRRCFMDRIPFLGGVGAWDAGRSLPSGAAGAGFRPAGRGPFPVGGLSSEVQRFVEKEFKRRFPAQAFARATI